MEKLFKMTSISARLTKDDMELIDDNYEYLTGGVDELSGRQLIMSVVEKAISKKQQGNSKEAQEKINQLQEENKNLSNLIVDLKSDIANLEEENKNNDNPDEIVLDFDEKVKQQFWGVLELCKKTVPVFANTYEELFIKMLYYFQKPCPNCKPQGNFILTDEDYQYLKRLKNGE